MSAPGFRAVVFDLFGTLVATSAAPDYRASLAAAARVAGVDEEAFLAGWQDTYEARNRGEFATLEDNLAAVCRRLGAEPGAAARAAALAPFRALLARLLKPKPEAVCTLAELRRRGLPLGLCSNCNPDVPALFARGPLAPFFRAVVFSARDKLMKPEAAIYRLILERLGAQPATTIYVGDGHDRELTGAKALGMRTVLVVNEQRGVVLAPCDESADLRVRDLREVAGLLGK